MRWRRFDLQKLIKQRFGVDYHERYVGTLLKELGFSHISARPRHPGQDGEIVEAYKKLPSWGKSGRIDPAKSHPAVLATTKSTMSARSNLNRGRRQGPLWDTG